MLFIGGDTDRYFGMIREEVIITGAQLDIMFVKRLLPCLKRFMLRQIRTGLATSFDNNRNTYLNTVEVQADSNNDELHWKTIQII